MLIGPDCAGRRTDHCRTRFAHFCRNSVRQSSTSHNGQRPSYRSGRGCRRVRHACGPESTVKWWPADEAPSPSSSQALWRSCCWSHGRWVARDRPRSTADRLLLLVPDGTSFSDPRVTVWSDAGSEEGLHVVPVHDSEFLRPFLGEFQCAGVILPDSIHQRASDLFIATLHRFVAQGGKLMLVYDAGTFSLALAAMRQDAPDCRTWQAWTMPSTTHLETKPPNGAASKAEVRLSVRWKYRRENIIPSRRKPAPPIRRELRKTPVPPQRGG